MSYDRMDHAGWVQDNIAAAQRRKPTAGDTRAAANNRGWFAAPAVLNCFHIRAFSMLGVVGGGIYNAPIEWTSVEWADDFLCVNWRYELATRDFMGLTSLVFLAHDAAIRVSVSPNMRHLQLLLHRRDRPPESGSHFKGHPTLESAVADHRARFPIGHSRCGHHETGET